MRHLSTTPSGAVPPASDAVPEELADYLSQAEFRFLRGFRQFRRPQVPCPEHEHECLQLLYHAAGGGATRVRGAGAFPLAAGSAIVYFPGVPHDQTYETPVEDWILHLFVVRSNPPPFPACCYLRQLRAPLLVSEIEALSQTREPRSPLERTSLDCRAGAVLTGILAMSQVPPESLTPAGRRYAEAAHQYLEEHYATVLRIEQVAAHLGISHSHLRHLYRARYRVSLVQDLARLRVQKAEELLRETGLTLTAIAARCGFSNERYFSEVFRRQTGSPPGAYRLQHR